MKKGRIIGIVVVVLWLLASSWFRFYNSTLVMSENLDALDKQVANMYDRRADLVPQLAAVVKRYAEYESGTLANVVSLREPANQLVNLQGMIAKGEANTPAFNNLLASTLSQVKLTVEQYPNLKADQQFTALFTELEGSENRIRVAIKDYNDSVGTYNIKVRSLPWGRLFGAIFGLQAKERIAPAEGKDYKAVPNVDQLLK